CRGARRGARRAGRCRGASFVLALLALRDLLAEARGALGEAAVLHVAEPDAAALAVEHVLDALEVADDLRALVDADLALLLVGHVVPVAFGAVVHEPGEVGLVDVARAVADDVADLPGEVEDAVVPGVAPPVY